MDDPDKVFRDYSYPDAYFRFRCVN